MISNMADKAELRNMVMSFRVSELQMLLGVANQSRCGRKSELMQKAFLLVDRGVNSQVQQKIRELYQKYSQRLNTGYTSYLMKNHKAMGLTHEGESLSPMNVNGPVMGISGAGLSGMINGPIIGVGMPPNNNNGNCIGGGSQSAGSQIHSDIRLKHLPFCDVLCEVMKPTGLVPRVAGRVQECRLPFTLTEHLVHEISKFKEVNPQTNQMEFGNQLQLRFCLIDSSSRQPDSFPSGVIVKVNGVLAQLPNLIPTNKPGAEPKRPNRPVDITRLCRLSSTITNMLVITWNLEDANKLIESHCVSINLVRKLNSNILLQRLKRNGTCKPEQTKTLIREKLSLDKDVEIATTSLRVSLLCPLGKMRMTIPCRATSCSHLQCFDASTYLQMNEKKPTWICPVCDRPADFNKLIIDGLLIEILRTTGESTEVELMKDGSWAITKSDQEMQQQHQHQQPTSNHYANNNCNNNNSGYSNSIERRDNHFSAGPVHGGAAKETINRSEETGNRDTPCVNNNEVQSVGDEDVIDLTSTDDEAVSAPPPAKQPKLHHNSQHQQQNHLKMQQGNSTNNPFHPLPQMLTNSNKHNILTSPMLETNENNNNVLSDMYSGCNLNNSNSILMNKFLMNSLISNHPNNQQHLQPEVLLERGMVNNNNNNNNYINNMNNNNSSNNTSPYILSAEQNHTKINNALVNSNNNNNAHGNHHQLNIVNDAISSGCRSNMSENSENSTDFCVGGRTLRRREPLNYNMENSDSDDESDSDVYSQSVSGVVKSSDRNRSSLLSTMGRNNQSSTSVNSSKKLAKNNNKTNSVNSQQIRPGSSVSGGGSDDKNSYSSSTSLRQNNSVNNNKNNAGIQSLSSRDSPQVTVYDLSPINASNLELQQQPPMAHQNHQRKSSEPSSVNNNNNNKNIRIFNNSNNNNTSRINNINITHNNSNNNNNNMNKSKISNFSISSLASSTSNKEASDIRKHLSKYIVNGEKGENNINIPSLLLKSSPNQQSGTTFSGSLPLNNKRMTPKMDEYDSSHHPLLLNQIQSPRLENDTDIDDSSNTVNARLSSIFTDNPPPLTPAGMLLPSSISHPLVGLGGTSAASILGGFENFLPPGAVNEASLMEMFSIMAAGVTDYSAALGALAGVQGVGLLPPHSPLRLVTNNNVNNSSIKRVNNLDNICNSDNENEFENVNNPNDDSGDNDSLAGDNESLASEENLNFKVGRSPGTNLKPVQSDNGNQNFKENYKNVSSTKRREGETKGSSYSGSDVLDLLFGVRVNGNQGAKSSDSSNNIEKNQKELTDNEKQQTKQHTQQVNEKRSKMDEVREHFMVNDKQQFSVSERQNHCDNKNLIMGNDDGENDDNN